ncbi:MAG: geranylgeranylglycerol-phosphate geranylgeranyltransferase [Candidatus Methanomethylophilaceae archaeon]|nr:geranylgeranylglycerol-phosphate geranylgeranyltransferase [Candidatus Methanomethylophilaceae archaeon]
MNKYLGLFRPVNCVMGVIGVLVACFMAAGTGVVDHLVELAIIAVVVFLFIAGGNALNDSIDAEIDKVAHPERPIPSGKMTVRTARNLGVGFLVLSVAISLLTRDVWCIAVVVVADVLMFSYEMFLKQRGFVGNVTIAVLTGMVFLLGSAAMSDIMDNAIVAAMACLVSIGREISKDIEDMEGDEGRSTLPMRIGTRNASVVAAVFFIAGPILSVIPMIQGTYSVLYYFMIVADALFVYAAGIVFKDPHKGQKTAKFGMIAGLVSFILGAISV